MLVETLRRTALHGTELARAQAWILRQRLLFHDGPHWQQLNRDVREQLFDHLADMCLEIVNGHTQEKDEEQSDDFEN